MPMHDTLKQLQDDMRRELDGELFFFPEADGVKGFYGDGKVWFIAPKPSSKGSFPTRHDELLYETLREFGVPNAHLTDISKIRGEVVDEIPEEELEQNRPFFEREIEILEPELLVTVGNGAKTALERLDIAPIIERNHIRHYSWASRWGHEEEFEDDVAQIAEIAKARGIHDTC
jgi:hypothetical protein